MDHPAFIDGSEVRVKREVRETKPSARVLTGRPCAIEKAVFIDNDDSNLGGLVNTEARSGGGGDQEAGGLDLAQLDGLSRATPQT